MADRYNSNIVSPLHVLLLMIVERLIKIHRYPIYLHYSLLQMCVELKVPEKVPRFSKYLPILIFIHAFLCFQEGKESNLNFSPNKILHADTEKQIKATSNKANCTVAICWRWYNRRNWVNFGFYGLFHALMLMELEIAHRSIVSILFVVQFQNTI